MATIVGSDEIFKKISSQIDSQFPGFIREEGPQFVSFLKAYFEYMEQSGNAVNSIRTLRENKDIDRTVDSFVEYFRREFMLNIPKETLADKRLMVKHVRDFYRTRGSQESYRFLFRALFGQEIDFYYPGDDILRASDGRWVKEVRIRSAAPFSTNPRNFEGKRIRGNTSKATAFVQDVVGTIASGIEVYDMTVENVVGTFVDGERIVDVDNSNNYATINAQAGSLIGIDITKGGAFHNLGDSIQISEAGSTEVASAVVAEVTNKSAVTLKLVKAGSGYTKEGTRVSIVNGNGYEFDAKVESFKGQAISGVSINTDLIGPMKNVRLDTPSFFVRKGANTSSVEKKLTGTLSTSSVSNTVTGSGTNFVTQLSVGSIVRITGVANTARVHSITNATSFISAFTPFQTVSGANGYTKLAGANVSSRLITALTFSNAVFYSINAITLINPGYGYNTTLPTIRIYDELIAPLNSSDGSGGILGNNAIVLANNAPGSISKLRIITPGANFNKYEDATILNLSQSNAAFTESQASSYANSSPSTRYLIRKKTFSATGKPNPSGFLELPGRYIDTKGFLSWNNRLQDNEYYQEFSYVIRVAEVLEKYKSIIKSLVHPAGSALFGDYMISSSVDIPSSIIDAAPSTVQSTVTESITTSSTQTATAAYNSGIDVTESITATVSQNGTFVANGIVTESITASATHQGQRFAIMSGVYGKVLYANSQIQSLQSSGISLYAPITIATFDGSPRLVIGTKGTLGFANGAMKANSGSISVGGRGSNLYLVPVAGSNTTIFNVNAIFSNAAFSIRTNYIPTQANVQIYYSTGP